MVSEKNCEMDGPIEIGKDLTCEKKKYLSYILPSNGALSLSQQLSFLTIQTRYTAAAPPKEEEGQEGEGEGEGGTKNKEEKDIISERIDLLDSILQDATEEKLKEEGKSWYYLQLFQLRHKWNSQLTKHQISKPLNEGPIKDCYVEKLFSSFYALFGN